MRILFIGDIVGRPGRAVLGECLPDLIREEGVSLTVANAENAAGGFGLTPEVADDLFALGIDVLTLGNHTWDKKEIVPLLERDPRVVRPLNYPPGTPGRGYTVRPSRDGVPVAVINLHTRVFASAQLDCPFRALDACLDELRGVATVVLVDAHGEATSEKQALGWYADGRVTGVIGTHTHVPSADERVLPGGTAYQTDAGMTGPSDSIIGMEVKQVLERFLTQRPVRLEPASGPRQLCGTLIDVDPATGRATGIRRIRCEGRAHR